MAPIRLAVVANLQFKCSIVLVHTLIGLFLFWPVLQGLSMFAASFDFTPSLCNACYFRTNIDSAYFGAQRAVCYSEVGGKS